MKTSQPSLSKGLLTGPEAPTTLVSLYVSAALRTSSIYSMASRLSSLLCTWMRAARPCNAASMSILAASAAVSSSTAGPAVEGSEHDCRRTKGRIQTLFTGELCHAMEAYNRASFVPAVCAVPFAPSAFRHDRKMRQRRSASLAIPRRPVAGIARLSPHFNWEACASVC